MAKKVIAIVGTYRKNHITDTAVTTVLEAAGQAGAQTEKIYLLDRHIEFCTNCRSCTQEQSEKRGKCPVEDDMPEILDKIDSADGLVLASPVNFFTVTAITKRFIERLICYIYWPWNTPIPKNRNKIPYKKAIIITSAACPAFISRILIPSPVKILKTAAMCLGAKVVSSLYFGKIALTVDEKLPQKYLKNCRLAGQKLAT